ncbi:hypothetical protein TNCV_1215611 [Trichonephila clavipes]|nr:hypothetical protein TNCV_1215611 [Trichonephila clavipes]
MSSYTFRKSNTSKGSSARSCLVSPRHCTVHGWGKVVSSVSHRTRAHKNYRRHSSQGCQSTQAPPACQAKDTNGGVMVWGAVAYDTQSPLILIHSTTTYVHDILQSLVLPLTSGLPGAILQQDNARPHTERMS